MTADEFLRDLAKRVEVVQIVPSDLDEAEDPAEHMEPTLAIVIDPYDADEFLALTGIRVE